MALQQQSTAYDNSSAMYDEIQRRLRGQMTAAPTTAPTAQTADAGGYPAPVSGPLPAPTGNTGVTGGMEPGEYPMAAATSYEAPEAAPQAAMQAAQTSLMAAPAAAAPQAMQMAMQTAAPAPQAATMAAPSGAAPAGFSGDKWANASHQSPKYIWGRAYDAVRNEVLAIPDQAGREAYIQNLVNELKPQFKAANMDVLQQKGHSILVDAHDGHGPTWVDLARDIEGKAETRWGIDAGANKGQTTGLNPDQARIAAAKAGAGDAARKAAEAAAGKGPVGGTTTKPTTMESIFNERLKALMAQNPDLLTENDPAVKNVIAAGDLGLSRANEMRQAQLAEQMASEGLGDSGALQAGTERGIQDYGEASAVMRSGVMLQELTARREQLMQALQLGGATLDAKKQRELSLQLARIDAAIREKGLEVQKSLGMANVGLGYAGLSQADRQFYDTLGWDMGKFQQIYNSGLFG